MADSTSDPTAVITGGVAPVTPPFSPTPPLGSPSGWEVRLRDGTVLADITGIAMAKSLTFRLNRPASCTFRVPSYLVKDIQADGRPLLCAGYRQLSVTLQSMGLCFHGIVWNIEEDGDEDMVYSQVTCYDPMMLWRYRPARDLVDSYSGDAGNLSDPSFLARNQFGGPIMEEILLASENYALAPSEAEGQLFIDLASSSFEGGGADLSGAPTNWPMTIAEIASLLTNTGEIDIVIVPIIGGVGSTIYTPGTADLIAQDVFQNMAEVHTYNAYTTDRTASVHFDFATGDNNVRLFRRSENMDTFISKNFYFLGARKDQQHWRSNVTGDHPDLPDPPGGDVNPYVPGDNPLGDLIEAGREEIGVFMQIGVYDNFGSGESADPDETSVYPLFLRQWQVESLLRSKPRNMVYVTPVRSGAELPAGGDVFGPGDFDIGDTVTINIGDKARVAESGVQRIYQYTVDIDDDGVEALGEFQCSPDQDTI